MRHAKWVAWATVAAVLGGWSAIAAAQWKPTKPVEVVVHTGPGGGNDVLGRALAQMMEKEKLLPVRMQVINKPGGNGAVAASFLKEKEGDPHTIGLITSVWIATPLVSKEAKVTLKDLQPIARLMLEPAVIVVRADSPYKTLGEFIAAAKAKPGQLKQSGGSLTSRDNLVHQALQAHTGAKWAFVSFPGGGERVAALLGGHVDMMVIEPQEAGEQIRAGKLRAIAQISDHRLAGMPDVPTMKEAGFDLPLAPQIRGVVAPPGVPKEVVAFWEDAFGKLVRTASWKKYLADNQVEEGYQDAADFAKSIDAIEKQLRPQLEQAGVKLAR
jgi:putative tricarboxylic transport membrane protein